MINRDLLQQSVRIFDSQEKWNALFEIYSQSNDIIQAWMETGAEALRSDFAARPSVGWTCVEWEAKRETKWFISDLGRDSICLAFAWPYWEIHLFYKLPAEFDETEAKRLVSLDEFRPLRALFAPEKTPDRGGKYRLLASDSTFNPFSGLSEEPLRQRELAWYAAHETDRFVKEVSNRMRQITDDAALTKLVRDLNRRAKRTSNGEPTA